MIARASVYLDAARARAVPEGDPAARFLFVRKGCEISEKEATRIPGAIELIGGTKASQSGVQAQETALQNRVPEAARPRAGRG